MKKLLSNIISVIIPIYNVASYLDRCIESITSQTFDNLEIILVDDGSPDECPALCDAWAEKDRRIRVIHKKNGGLSDARNVGIEMAKGKYILFVDGDDYIAPNMCERLLAAVENSGSDIAMCSFYWDFSDHRKVQSMTLPDGTVVPRSEILENWVRQCGVEFVVAWNKLYRRELFFMPEHIRYPIGRLHEDEFVSYRLLYAAKKVVFVDEPLYYYVQRSNSIMANYGERNLYDFIEAIRGYIRWADKYAPVKRKLMEYMTMQRILDIIIHSTYILKYSHGHKLSILLQEHVKLYVQSFFCNPYASLKDKIKYVLFRLNIFVPVMKLWINLKILKGHSK